MKFVLEDLDLIELLRNQADQLSTCKLTDCC